MASLLHVITIRCVIFSNSVKSMLDSCLRLCNLSVMTFFKESSIWAFEKTFAYFKSSYYKEFRLKKLSFHTFFFFLRNSSWSDRFFSLCAICSLRVAILACNPATSLGFGIPGGNPGGSTCGGGCCCIKCGICWNLTIEFFVQRK